MRLAAAAGVLLATLLAFFGAVGLAAHALDELNGRPLRTSIPSSRLVIAATAGLALAIGLGVGGVYRVGLVLVPFLVVGPLLVVGYNLELGRGMFHNDIGFGATWGAFPVLVAYVGQTGSLSLAAAMAAAGAMAMSMAQRSLSSPARVLRRRVVLVQGQARFCDGRVLDLDEASLLAPLERALKAMSWAVVFISGALAVARLT